jgi:hypothetical protein
MWVLAGDQDPSFSSDKIAGTVFGLRDDFKGFGVCFDVYDNDNRRNNPSVFVLKNPKGEKTNFNHDNDYDDDLVKTLPFLTPFGITPQHTAHKCVADIRNIGKQTKVLVKYLHNVVHVYVDSQEGLGYKFCLAVKLEEEYKDHHLAFTAATGQVADNHDIIEITTRYLAESDKEFNDDELVQLSDSNSVHHSLSTLLWLGINVANAALIAAIAYQLYLYKNLTTARIDLVKICQELNPLVLPQYAGHAILTIFFLFTGNYYAFLFNLPLLAYRAYEFKQKIFLFSPATVAPAKGHAKGLISVNSRLIGTLVFYSLMQLYYLYRLAY